MNTMPRPEHPLPQWERSTWKNLNGEWDFSFDFGKSGVDRCFYEKKDWEKKIIVPFCPESDLSGICYNDYMGAVWYHKTVDLTEVEVKGRVLLHFGAVDYDARVWINGTEVGRHKGGYTSFTFDITAYVQAGANDIAVYAEDDLRSGKQPHGKQSGLYYSHGCEYTRTTGIWQTVWLEFVPENYVKKARFFPNVEAGTITIEASEQLSGMLRREGIQHKVLNAKFHELEAEIVADAGIHGAVTIATNMAGRGTDIKLDEEAKAAGGLKIIGTERHESRRIDNQLRGRSGRQGDPGESRFYISLEDDLMRLFGSEKMISMFNALGIPEGQEIEHKMLSKAIENAQKKIEGNNFGIRKNLLEYDQVNNEQREIIYAERRRVLDGESMRDVIYKMITDIVDNTVDMVIGEENDSEEWNLAELNSLLLPIIPLEPITKERISKPKKDSLKQQLKEEAVRFYETKEAEFPEPEMIREAERVVLLKVIDRKWMNHIDDMDQLRQGIGLQAYGQRDPLVEYKMNAYEMFENMTESIKEDTIRVLCHIRIEQKVEREQVAKVTGTNKDESGPRRPAKRESVKIYPNDPCPCGSGKKYKNCCGKNR